MKKQLFFAALSALIVFLVWLFYPVKTPPTALQAFLPAACKATFSVREPAKVVRFFRDPQFHAALKNNWLLAQITTATNEIVVDEEVTQTITTLDHSWFGWRNCLAFSLGVFDENIATVFAVDNLGTLVLKILSWFAPTETLSNGFTCRRVSLANLSENLPTFYLAAIPQTRYFIAATDRELLTQYRLSAISSSTADNPLPAVEITAELSPAECAKIPLTLAKNLSAARFTWSWDLQKIQCLFTATLPANTLPPLTNIAPLAVFSPLPEQQGLYVGVSVQPEYLANFLLPNSNNADDFPAIINQYAAQISTFLQTIGGDFFLQINPANPQLDLIAVTSLVWTVRDAEAAIKNYAETLNAIFNPPQKNFFERLATAALTQIAVQPQKIIFKTPLISESIYLDGVAANKNYVYLRSVEDLPPPVTAHAAAPATLAAGRLHWRYTPEFRALVAAWVNTNLHGGVFNLLRNFLPRGQITTLTELLKNALIAADFFTAFNTLDLYYFLLPAETGEVVLQINAQGELRW